MKPEEAEMMRKTGGKGPGGCRGRACETYCNDEANQEACMTFAQEHGLMRPEDTQRMEEGRNQMRQAAQGGPPELQSCIEGIVGAEGSKKMMGRQMGDQIRSCFEKFMGPPPGFGPNGQQGPGGQQGEFPGRPGEFPGGGATNGQFPGGQGGPGGCSSQEECQAYCQAHPDECGGGGGQQGGPQGEFPGGGATDGQFPGIGQGEGGPQGMTPEQYQNRPAGEGFRDRMRQNPVDTLRQGFRQQLDGQESGQGQGFEGQQGGPGSQSQQQYQNQVQNQIQGQIQQQYQQQYQQQMQQNQPTSPDGGTYSPPTNIYNTYSPPPSYTSPPSGGTYTSPPSGGTYTPPSGGGMMPPPPSTQ